MPTGSGSSSSSKVILNVVEPSFKVTKSSNKSNVKVGDTFFYTINIVNDGDYAATSVIITDILPTEFSVVEIKVNGVVVVGDLSTGLDVGPLDVGDSLVVIIEVEVTSDILDENGFRNEAIIDFLVVLDPLSPPTTLTVETQSSSSVKVFNPELELLKSSNILDAAVGDTVTYTIVVENTGNVILTNIIVRDLLDKCLLFVSRSLTMDGVKVTTANISSGVRINSLNPGESVVIKFDVLVVGDLSKVNANTSTAQFNYQIDCNSFKQTGFTTSNLSELNILYHHVILTKDADSCNAKLNRIIDYVITIENDGDVDILEFILKDRLPSNIRLIEDTFRINDVPFNVTRGDLLKGISIGPILMGEASTVKFSVKISPNYCCLTCPINIRNFASGVYYFELEDGSGRCRNSEEVSNLVTICR